MGVEFHPSPKSHTISPKLYLMLNPSFRPALSPSSPLLRNPINWEKKGNSIPYLLPLSGIVEELVKSRNWVSLNTTDSIWESPQRPSKRLPRVHLGESIAVVRAQRWFIAGNCEKHHRSSSNRERSCIWNGPCSPRTGLACISNTGMWMGRGRRRGIPCVLKVKTGMDGQGVIELMYLVAWCPRDLWRCTGQVWRWRMPDGVWWGETRRGDWNEIGRTLWLNSRKLGRN